MHARRGVSAYIVVMKDLLVMVFILICGATCTSQNLYEHKFEGCDTNLFGLDAGVNQDAAPLLFEQRILDQYTSTQLKAIDAVVNLQVLIYEDGTACLLSAHVQGNRTLEELNVKSIVDTTIGWDAGIEEDSDIQSSSVGIRLDYNHGFLTVRRMSLPEIMKSITN